MSEPARCRGCKRRLKRASPSGYGPVCERRLNGAPVAAPRIASPAVDMCDGQTELDLNHHQPTLWSI